MISVLLATTGRPAMATAVIENIAATTAGHDIEIVVASDCEPVAIPSVGCSVVVDHRDELRGSSRAWNDALRLASGDPIVLAADDVEFHAGWLDRVLETLGTFPDGWGMVGLNDGHWDGRVFATHYVMSRRLIADVFGGVVAWDCYTHSFQDREACGRAHASGRYAFCPEARITHRHWLWGDRPQDMTDTRNLHGHSESERAFLVRSAAGFPNDQEAVI